jgi:hypothetical protein
MNMQEQGVQCSEQAPLQGNEVGWGLSLRQEFEWVFLGGENAKKAGVERSGRQVKPQFLAFTVCVHCGPK